MTWNTQQTAADESAGNGRVESEIAHLKHHTKLLLTTARASANYWPMATEACQRIQISQDLGAIGRACPTAYSFRNRSHCEIEVLASNYEGISYTHAEGQSVGTCGRHEFVKRT